MNLAFTEQILAQIPPELAERVVSGTAERIGMIVRDSASKKIIGHLQETGLTQSIVSRFLENAPGGLAALSNPVSAVGTLATLYQNQKISKQLDLMQTMMGGLQALQIATLVTSVAGIGVSVAGTMVVLKRLKGIENRLETIQSRIEETERRSEDAAIRSTLSRIETYLERLAEAEHVHDIEFHLRSTEEQLHASFGELSRQTATVAARQSIDSEFLIGLLSALSLCSNAQVRSLVSLNELGRAEGRALGQAAALNEIAIVLPRDVLSGKLGKDSGKTAEVDLVFSELRLRSAGLPSFVKSLATHGIDGREYFRVASAEQSQGLLLLPSPER